MLAGVALLVAGILIPAQRELHELRGQQAVVEATEARVYARLEAYDRFLTDLRSQDTDLVRRLAIAHLNMVPKGEQSLLLTPGLDQTVAEWIDESVPAVQVQPEPYPDTLLGRLAVGPNRLWLLAASVFLLFIGLLLGPDTARPLPAATRRGDDDSETPGGAKDGMGGDGDTATAVMDADPADDVDLGGRLAALGVVAASAVAVDAMASVECPASDADADVIDVEVVDHAVVTPEVVADGADLAMVEDECLADEFDDEPSDVSLDECEDAEDDEADVDAGSDEDADED